MLVPMMLSAIAASIVGRLVTRTGYYKGLVLAGLVVLTAGYFLLTRMGYGSTRADLTLATVVGLGLGGSRKENHHVSVRWSVADGNRRA